MKRPGATRKLAMEVMTVGFWIRAETGDDQPAVFALNTAVFPSDAEARLVDVLRDSVDDHISLLAVGDSTVVGHIMFTPVSLGHFQKLKLMGLGPMAVSPAEQNGGIGSGLVMAGLQSCRNAGAGAVVVLGHPGYYPRFGFEPSGRFAIRSEYDVPEDVFMLLELQPGYLAGYAGIIRYHPAFANV